MNAPQVVAVQFAFALLAYTLVAVWWIAPALATRPISRALPPLVLPHLLRPISLWLLVPGAVVREGMPLDFAVGTAMGDLVAAGLAIVTAIMVRKEVRGAVVVAWIFNVVGTVDALRNCVVGMRTAAPEYMGAMVFVPAYGVPLLLVSHALVFKVLLDHRRRGV
jgi:hypothetical protein